MVKEIGGCQQGETRMLFSWVSAYAVNLFIFSVSKRGTRVLERNGMVDKEVTTGISMSLLVLACQKCMFLMCRVNSVKSNQT